MKILALSAALAVGVLTVPGRARADLPVQAPPGWDVKKQEGAVLMTPSGMPEGTFYTVVIPEMANKVGSVRGLLDAAKASLGEVATFKPATEPGHSKNDQGWEYDVVIGPLQKDGKTIFAQAMGLKRGEAEGIILVFSDSVPTMTRYSDAFTAMVRTLGAPKNVAVPPAATATAASGAGRAVDLQYRVPKGWTSKPIDGGVLLEKSENTLYDKYTFRILILPSEPLQASLRKTYLDSWVSIVSSSLATTIAPLPLMRRLKSGTAVAFDTDTGAKTKQGQAVNGGLFLLARGKRYVPIMVLFFGGVLAGQLETDLNELVESAEIPGAGPERVAMFAPEELVGDWSTSSASYASYVTSSGAYAGDASIATSESIVLRADRTFQKSFRGITSRNVVKEQDAGTWALEDMVLVEKGKETKSNWVLGVGADPKAGAFLVLSMYSNVEEKLKLCNPRGALQGTWFKRKE